MQVMVAAGKLWWFKNISLKLSGLTTIKTWDLHIIIIKSNVKDKEIILNKQQKKKSSLQAKEAP